MDVFGGFGVEFGSSTPVGGISQYDLGTGSQVANETTSGSVFPEYPVLTGQQVKGSFTSLQIARGLAACPLLGTSLAGLSGGLKFYLRKREDGAARAAGSVHNKYSLLKGIVVPTSLTCNHQGDATISFDVIVGYDGVNNPIVIAVNQALPSGLVDDQRFTLGAITVGGVSLGSIQQFTINFGLDVQSIGSGSEIWDEHQSIAEAKPSITLMGIDPQWFGASGVSLTGLPCTHANTIFYIRKRLTKSTFTADGVAEHVKFTADGMATIDNTLQVSGQEPSECTMTIACRYDGTLYPLTIDTASTIT